jgi:hypothetical protein
MAQIVFVSAKLQKILRQRGITMDEAPATRPAAIDTEPLTEKEKLDIFLRFNSRIFPSPETEMSWARMTNAANREKYGK